MKMHISRHRSPQPSSGEAGLPEVCYLAFDSTFSGRIARVACLGQGDEDVLLAEADYRDSADLGRLLRWLTLATAGRPVVVRDVLETRFCLQASSALAQTPTPTLQLQSLALPLPPLPYPCREPFVVERVRLMREVTLEGARCLCRN